MTKYEYMYSETTDVPSKGARAYELKLGLPWPTVAIVYLDGHVEYSNKTPLKEKIAFEEHLASV